MGWIRVTAVAVIVAVFYLIGVGIFSVKTEWSQRTIFLLMAPGFVVLLCGIGDLITKLRRTEQVGKK